MNKKLLLPLFAFAFLSCSGEENADIASDFNDVTVSNFPVIDGSSSTSPLRYILIY